MNIKIENQTHAIEGMQEAVGDRDGGIVIQSRAAAGDVCLSVCLSAQTVSRVHLVFYSTRTGGSLFGGKRLEREADR